MDEIVEEDLEIWGWRTFFEQITQFLQQLHRHFGTANENYALYAVERLEVCVANVRDLRYHLNHGPTTAEASVIFEQYDAQLTELLHCLEALCNKWSEYCDEVLQPNVSHAYRTPTECFGSRGRPRLCITRNQIEYLKSLAFTWSDMASVIGVSRMTIYRRRLEYGMLDDPSELLTDDELQQKLRQMYGVDEGGLSGSDKEILIPQSITLTTQQEDSLRRSINPLADTDNYGIEIYEQTLDFLRSIVVE